MQRSVFNEHRLCWFHATAEAIFTDVSVCAIMGRTFLAHALQAVIMTSVQERLACSNCSSVQIHMQADGLSTRSTYGKSLSITTAPCCSSCSSASYRLRLHLSKLLGVVVTTNGCSACAASISPVQNIMTGQCLACSNALFRVRLLSVTCISCFWWQLPCLPRRHASCVSHASV